MASDSKKNLQLFYKMIQSVYNVGFWTFNSHFQLVKSHCAHSSELFQFFSFDIEQVNNLMLHAHQLQPVVLTNQLSMVWLVDFEPASAENDTIILIHMIGPVFTEQQPLLSLRNRVSGLTLSSDLRTNFSSLIDSIPFVPMPHFHEYGIMMHYCITGEKITASDYSYITTSDNSEWEIDTTPLNHLNSSWMTWAAEEKMYQCIEKGDLHYKDYVNQLSYSAVFNHIGNGSQLRQIKNLAIIFTSHCSRAAIRGGLDPDIAYDLSARYISSVENCKTVPAIAEINALMQDDFVKRVHRRRTHTEISPQIQKCCSYIQLHLGEQISLSQLAQYIGYSESHLSKKFKEDTGKTIKEYTMDCRIEKAKQLLHTSSLQISEICADLGFSSQSYFGSQFRKATGVTPSTYRNNLLFDNNQTDDE